MDKSLPGRQLSTVIKKVLIDQTVASPIVISLFFVTLGIMRQEKLHETLQEIKHKALRLYTAEWVRIFDVVGKVSDRIQRFKLLG